MSTLSFAIYGTAKQDGTYNVKLRYTYTTNKKTKLIYLKTPFYLLPLQVDQLKKGQLGGNVQKELFQLKNQYEELIQKICSKTGRDYATKEEIENRLKKPNYNAIDIDFYGSYWLQTKNITSTSIRTYKVALHRFKSFVGKELRTELLDEDLLITFEKYLITQNLAPVTVTYFMTTINDFVKYLCKEHNLPIPIFKPRKPIRHEQYNLTKEDIEKLFLPIESRYYKLKYVQAALLLNLECGLRISEIINIKKNHISFIENNLAIIKIFEQKKKRSREIIIKDNYNLIKSFFERTKDNLFPWKNTNAFHHIFKRFLQHQFKDEKVFYIKKNGYNIEQVEVEKWKLITFHATRRFAINNLINKYGIKVAQVYSGHSTLSTLERHYLTLSPTEDVISIILKKD